MTSTVYGVLKLSNIVDIEMKLWYYETLSVKECFENSIEACWSAVNKRKWISIKSKGSYNKGGH